jgi:hypothetical protein
MSRTNRCSPIDTQIYLPMSKHQLKHKRVIKQGKLMMQSGNLQALNNSL